MILRDVAKFLDGKNDVVRTELKTKIRSIQNLKKNNFDLEKNIFLIFNLIIVRELCTNKRKKPTNGINI